MNLAHMFQIEVIEAELKVNERFLVLAAWVEEIDEATSDLLVETVICQVQA